jgi:hypothetical protein
MKTTDNAVSHQMFQISKQRKQYIQVEVMNCRIYAFDILLEDGPSLELIALTQLKHVPDNLSGTRRCVDQAFRPAPLKYTTKQL